jgi:tRNA (guanine-N7-)-methyltransferase
MRVNSSFARRVGRTLRTNQNKLLNDFLPIMNRETGIYIDENNLLAFSENDTRKKILEIGFGNGNFLYNLATQQPENLFIGCEPYLNGVANLLNNIQQDALNNIYIWPDDANILLSMANDNVFDEVYLLFSDPWPKNKHHKRRIVNQDFLLKIANKLKEHGNLIIATDHLEYAKWIIKQIIMNDLFKFNEDNVYSWYMEKDDYIKTKYQLKAERKSIKSFYFHLEKI